MSEYLEALRVMDTLLGATPIAYRDDDGPWVHRAMAAEAIRAHARQFHDAPVEGWSDEELLRLHDIAHQGWLGHVHKEAP